MEEIMVKGTCSESKEKLMTITMSEYDDLIREAAEATTKLYLIENALICDVPPAYIREMLYGVKSESETAGLGAEWDQFLRGIRSAAEKGATVIGRPAAEGDMR